MDTLSNRVRAELIALSDPEYRDFSSSLLPTVPRESIIGVCIPRLREIAKKLYKSVDVSHFLADLPHKYLEENTLHALVICEISDVSECISELDRFLPYVDNWATCDSIRPRTFRGHTDELLKYILSLVHSTHTYTARFGIEMLMVNYMGDGFRREFLDTVSGIRTDDYYLRMMVAWYFATALTLRYDETVAYIEGRTLEAWVHNKAISKACDSRAIPREHKEYLKTLRIRGK
jgi:3-methyladenine DNA glycosylase AlkD